MWCARPGVKSRDEQFRTRNDGIPVGVSINASGQRLVLGNRGTVNDIDLSLGSMTVSLSQISGISSPGNTLNLVNQDGTSPGTLTSDSIDGKGVIHGSFDNGIVRRLGQVELARFPNPDGLLQDGNNDFLQGAASGLPPISAPGAFGARSNTPGACGFFLRDETAD